METLGWIGSLLLAFCGLPQAWDSYRTKQSSGITWGMITMWLAGECLTLAYVWPTMALPLIVNYTANILCLLVIIFYKVKHENLGNRVLEWNFTDRFCREPARDSQKVYRHR